MQACICTYIQSKHNKRVCTDDKSPFGLYSLKTLHIPGDGIILHSCLKPEDNLNNLERFFLAKVIFDWLKIYVLYKHGIAHVKDIG